MSETAGHAPPEFNPKHRILGAVVLVALAVIFVPMALERPAPADPPAPPVMEIPGKDKKIFVSKITPIIAPADTARGAVTVKPAGSAKPAGPAKAGKPRKPARTAKIGKPAKVPVAAASAAAVQEGWVVRVGTFSQPENARRIMATLKKKGFVPRSGVIESRGRQVTRVWVGPFVAREAAVGVRSRILKETGQEGLIVAYP